jgi:hypothetical protein
LAVVAFAWRGESAHPYPIIFPYSDIDAKYVNWCINKLKNMSIVKYSDIDAKYVNFLPPLMGLIKKIS